MQLVLLAGYWGIRHQRQMLWDPQHLQWATTGFEADKHILGPPVGRTTRLKKGLVLNTKHTLIIQQDDQGTYSKAI